MRTSNRKGHILIGQACQEYRKRRLEKESKSGLGVRRNMVSDGINSQLINGLCMGKGMVSYNGKFCSFCRSEF